MKKNIQFLIFTVLLIRLLSSMANEIYAFSLPDDSILTTEELESPELMQKHFNEVKRQIKENGYYQTFYENAANLIAFKDKKGFPITNDEDPYFSILRLNLTDFLLSFPFKGISSVDNIHLLGYAPGMSVEKGRWTGVSTYFVDDHLGVCRFNISDMKFIGGQSLYSSEYVTYDINEKPTMSSVKGSTESGFMYEATWTGKRYGKELECANKKPFDKQLLQDLVAYAKKIDNDLLDTP